MRNGNRFASAPGSFPSATRRAPAQGGVALLSACLSLVLAGCGQGLWDTTFPTGSQTVASSSTHDALYVVDNEGGLLHRYAVDSEAVSSIDVGSRPERVTRVGSRVFVTLRGERSLVEVADQGGKLSIVKTVEVGAEPLGVVAREDGTKLYVALSQEEAVVELDGASLAETRRWTVADQPSWLALHPSGDSLYVASAMQGRLSRIDLAGSDGVITLELPTTTGAGDSGKENFVPRLTGDPWIGPDGETIALPALYVDNSTLVDEPSDDGVSSGGYASSPSIAPSRFNPAVVLGELGPSGGLQSGVRAVFLAGFSPIKDGSELVRSYPTSATFSPSGDLLVVTMEASATAILLSPAEIASSGEDTGFCFDSGGGCGSSVSESGFARAASIFVSMDAGPRGAAFVADDSLFVHNFLDRNVRELGLLEGRSRLASRLGGSAEDLAGEMTGGASHPIHDGNLSEDEEAGRRYFYSAVKSQMAVDGAGVSCSTCHFEGRNDGLTWPFSSGVRNTPSLANQVAQTAPYTWTAGVASIAAEAMITSQGRMGGESLESADAEQIEAFISSIPEVDHAEKGVLGAGAARGKEIFERADVGCAGCHPAPLYADGESHPLYGLDAVDTPSLVGLVATAPYLHTGSAATLREVIDTAVKGQMGDASMLSASELDDLEAYLRSL